MKLEKFSEVAHQAMTSDGVVVEVIMCPERLDRWHLVNEYLKLRKQVFVDRLEWPLFHAEELEFEQYDSFDTVYVVASRHGAVVGGARLRRCDQVSGTGRTQYSYMIRDACLGILPGLPVDMCDTPPPVRSDAWEITRMVVNGPRHIFAAILQRANTYLAGKDAKTVLFLGSPAFQRMAVAWSWPVQTLGPIVGNGDGRFRVFECPVMAS